MGVGDRLKQIRKTDLKWSAKVLAEKTGVSQGSISLYESDSRAVSAKLLLALHQLGYNTGWILSGEGEMKRGLEVIDLNRKDPAVFAPKSRVQHLIQQAWQALFHQEQQQGINLSETTRADIVGELVTDSLLNAEDDINNGNAVRFVKFAGQKS